MFYTPKAYVKIDFNCPQAGNSPEADVLTDIFTRLLMDYLNEYGKKLILIRFLGSKGSFLCLFNISLSPPLPSLPPKKQRLLGKGAVQPNIIL